MASGSLDKTVRLWEVGSQTQRSSCRQICSGHKDFVLSVAFSPDGKWIISGSKDRTVQFWDPATGNVQCMLQGHKNSVLSVAIAPNALHFATGSGDCKARIWRSTPLPGLPTLPTLPSLAPVASAHSSALASLAGLAGLSSAALPPPTPETPLSESQRPQTEASIKSASVSREPSETQGKGKEEEAAKKE